MDINTGRMYPSVEAARADGVSESDIAEVEQQEGQEPKVRFVRGKPFASFKNLQQLKEMSVKK